MDSTASKKIEQFFSSFPVVRFEKGQIIIKPEDTITSLYLLSEGVVRMYGLSPEGEDITLSLFKPPTYFPLMIALSSTPSRYFFEVQERVVARKAPVEEVLAFIKNEPDILFDIATRFSGAINGLTQRIETLAFENSYNKIGKLLLYLSEKSGPVLEVTHADIASWLGLKRETVSRQVEKMQTEGFLTIENKKLTIVDRSRLEALLL